MPEDEIEIHFPSLIPEELKSVKGLSDAMKTNIAKKIEEGKIKLQSHKQDNSDAADKCNMILEILQDRAKFDKHITMNEVLEIADIEESTIANFMIKLMKLARERNLAIKKTKRDGVTCYKL